MGMLSLFPQILFLSPLAPTLLRFAAGVVFLLAAWTHYDKREELGRESFIVVGTGLWIPIVTSLVELGIAVGFVFGAYTQAVAIAGALAAMKYFFWKRRYPNFFPLSRSASALLFAICLSLVVTGPGAFALDLPL